MDSSDTLYDDEYPTCDETHVSLRIYSEETPPASITERLGVEPTSIQHKGQVRNPEGRRPVVLKHHGWFLESENHVTSKDVRRHLDWLLDRMDERAEPLAALMQEGARADIACFWMSASGHGGPTLSPSQMKRMAALGVDCWFDVYFGGE